MTKTKKPREFWIDDLTHHICGPWENLPDWPDNERVIHVIEYPAYQEAMKRVEELEAENLKLYGCPKCGVDRRYDLHDKISEIDRLKKQNKKLIEALEETVSDIQAAQFEDEDYIWNECEIILKRSRAVLEELNRLGDE